jgi:hypothetical protein
MFANIDLLGLLRAFLLSLAISVGSGLIGEALAKPLLSIFPKWSRWGVSAAVMLGGLIVALTATMFLAWPTLIAVPQLDQLSQAEAEQVLSDARLIPAAQPHYAPGVQAGRVLPQSQSPSPGLRVRPGTVVSFGISVQDMPTTAPATPTGSAVSLFEPKAGAIVRCQNGGDGICRVLIRGTSSKLTSSQTLLLWLKPVSPPADVPGWYLQRPPVTGIGKVQPDGVWTGMAQIGNAQWPAHEGDIVDIAITVVEEQTAAQLLAKPGVVVRDQPLGSVSDSAAGVVIKLQ